MIQKKVSGDYCGESKHMASSAFIGRIAARVNGDECANKKQLLTCDLFYTPIDYKGL